MIKINRFIMPASKDTFTILAVKKILNRYNFSNWADPFSGYYSPAKYKNDLNTKIPNVSHLDALDFLKTFKDQQLEGVLFDPPYSLTQVKTEYENYGLGLNEHTSSYFYYDIKNEIARIIKHKGKVISFGWDSNGMGRNRGFKIDHITLLSHGGVHHDTIIVEETKNQTKLFKESPPNPERNDQI